jgi:hypothetical protein
MRRIEQAVLLVLRHQRKRLHSTWLRTSSASADAALTISRCSTHMAGRAPATMADHLFNTTQQDDHATTLNATSKNCSRLRQAAGYTCAAHYLMLACQCSIYCAVSTECYAPSWTQQGIISYYQL